MINSGGFPVQYIDGKPYFSVDSLVDFLMTADDLGVSSVDLAITLKSQLDKEAVKITLEAYNK